MAINEGRVRKEIVHNVLHEACRNRDARLCMGEMCEVGGARAINDF